MTCAWAHAPELDTQVVLLLQACVAAPGPFPDHKRAVSRRAGHRRPQSLVGVLAILSLVVGSCGSSLGYGVAQQELGPFVRPRDLSGDGLKWASGRSEVSVLCHALLLSDLLFLSVRQG